MDCSISRGEAEWNGTVQILPCVNIPPIPLWATQYLYIISSVSFTMTLIISFHFYCFYMPMPFTGWLSVCTWVRNRIWKSFIVVIVCLAVFPCLKGKVYIWFNKKEQVIISIQKVVEFFIFFISPEIRIGYAERIIPILTLNLRNVSDNNGSFI